MAPCWLCGCFSLGDALADLAVQPAVPYKHPSPWRRGRLLLQHRKEVLRRQQQQRRVVILSMRMSPRVQACWTCAQAEKLALLVVYGWLCCQTCTVLFARQVNTGPTCLPRATSGPASRRLPGKGAAASSARAPSRSHSTAAMSW